MENWITAVIAFITGSIAAGGIVLLAMKKFANPVKIAGNLIAEIGKNTATNIDDVVGNVLIKIGTAMEDGKLTFEEVKDIISEVTSLKELGKKITSVTE